MPRQYNTAVFIGRTQPPHLGHVQTMMCALEQAERLVVVLGSHNATRTHKNPWSSLERQKMILLAMPEETHSRISFVYAPDHIFDNKAWCIEVKLLVWNVTGPISPRDVVLVGCRKDESSFYLDLFPEWAFVTPEVDVRLLSATAVREQLFNGTEEWKKLVPSTLYQVLEDFKKSQEFPTLARDYIHHSSAIPIDTAQSCYAVFKGISKRLLLYVLLMQEHGRISLPGSLIKSKVYASNFEKLRTNLCREISQPLYGEENSSRIERDLLYTKVFSRVSPSAIGIREYCVSTIVCEQFDDSFSDPRPIQPFHWYPIDHIKSLRDKFVEDHFTILMQALQELN